MDLFWVTCVIADDTGVWACNTGTPFLNLDEAIGEVVFKRNNYPTVVCAIIKRQHRGVKEMEPVFAECYIGPLGI